MVVLVGDFVLDGGDDVEGVAFFHFGPDVVLEVGEDRQI